MIVNVWLALRDDAQALVRERLAWDNETPYEGPVPDRVFKLFRRMADLNNTQRLFRIDTPVSRDWTVWSLYFDYRASVLQKIQDELDYLIATYPNRTRIVGAWHWDGRQVGTQFVYDVDGNITGVTGASTYLIHSRTIEFMPDVVIRDDEGNEISRTRPTELTDVNLLQGQKERRFD